MPQCIETKKYLDWLEENVGKKSLVAVNPMTAERMVDIFPELGQTRDERMFYAQQLVDLYNKKRKSVDSTKGQKEKVGGYTDLLAVGFYPTSSDREGDHFSSRKPLYKGIKITAGYDSYQIHHGKPFNKTFVDRREMLASVKAHGFTEDQFFADVEKHPLDAQLDPREKTTTVESIKTAVDQIVKNNEYLAKKYGTGTKA